nr:YitT family protein [Lysinibacillus timonensis]
MQYALYMLGIFILTLGITLTIQSNLGTSPFDALLVGLAINVGLTVGSWEIIIALLLICINSLLKRNRPEVLGLLTAFITGIGIDLWLFLLQYVIAPQFWFSKVVCFGFGLVLIGIGTAIYLQTNFAPIPIDRLTLIIKELTRTNLFFSRTLIYIVFLVLAMLFNGPIGIGTLLTVCLGGLTLNYFMPLTKNIIDSFLTTTQSDANKNHSI